MRFISLPHVPTQMDVVIVYYYLSKHSIILFKHRYICAIFKLIKTKLTSARLQKRLIFIKLETTFQPRIILKCLSKLLNAIQKEICD